MRLALRYGAPVAALFAAWVLLKRLWVPWEGPDPYPVIDAVLLNGASLIALILGIRASRTTNGGTLTVARAVGVGFAISFTYAALLTLFFLGVYGVVGPRLMANQAAASGVPQQQAVLQSFVALFVGLVIVGLVLSTVIGLVFSRATRPS